MDNPQIRINLLIILQEDLSLSKILIKRFPF